MFILIVFKYLWIKVSNVRFIMFFFLLLHTCHAGKARGDLLVSKLYHGVETYWRD